MATYKCPTCGTVTDIRVKKEVICPKCLESSGTPVIMLEQIDNSKPINVGGGLFIYPK